MLLDMDGLDNDIELCQQVLVAPQLFKEQRNGGADWQSVPSSSRTNKYYSSKQATRHNYHCRAAETYDGCTRTAVGNPMPLAHSLLPRLAFHTIRQA